MTRLLLAALLVLALAPALPMPHAVAAQPRSSGCSSLFERDDNRRLSQAVMEGYTFTAGEVVILTAREPSVARPATVSIAVDGTVVTSAPFAPAGITVTYTVPTTGPISMLAFVITPGAATLDFDCTPAPDAPSVTQSFALPDLAGRSWAYPPMTASASFDRLLVAGQPTVYTLAIVAPAGQMRDSSVTAAFPEGFALDLVTPLTFSDCPEGAATGSVNLDRREITLTVTGVREAYICTATFTGIVAPGQAAHVAIAASGTVGGTTVSHTDTRVVVTLR